MSTYTVQSADPGTALAVQVTATQAQGSASATSAEVGVPPAPVNTSPPTVSGDPQVDQTLTASTGTWSGVQPFTYLIQWQRCDLNGANCADISGATGPSYTVTSDDEQSTLRANVTASNASGSTAAASDSSDPVFQRLPSYSYYEETAAQSTLKVQGCKTKHSGRFGLILLHFGAPTYKNSHYGMTYPNQASNWATLGRIKDGVEAWVDGWESSSVTGSDGTTYNCASPHPLKNVLLQIGTSNNTYFPHTGWSFAEPPSSHPDPSAYTFGQRLVTFISYVDDYISNKGYPYVEVAGGDDIEPAWKPASESLPVLHGYDSMKTSLLMIDGGSAEGGFWSISNMEAAAWNGGAGLPLPQIYCSGQQNDWANLAHDQKSDHPNLTHYIYGVMTTLGVNCGTVKNPIPPYNACQAWTHLNDALKNVGLPNDLGPYTTQITVPGAHDSSAC